MILNDIYFDFHYIKLYRIFLPDTFLNSGNFFFIIIFIVIQEKMESSIRSALPEPSEIYDKKTKISKLL